MNQKQIIINIPSFPERNTEKSNNLKSMVKPIIIGTIAIIMSIGLVWAIGGNRAIQFALKDANLTQNQVSRMEFEFDMEGFTPTYDVEWHNNSIKQEYKIHAISGNILEIDWD